MRTIETHHHRQALRLRAVERCPASEGHSPVPVEPLRRGPRPQPGTAGEGVGRWGCGMKRLGAERRIRGTGQSGERSRRDPGKIRPRLARPVAHSSNRLKSQFRPQLAQRHEGHGPRDRAGRVSRWQTAWAHEHARGTARQARSLRRRSYTPAARAEGKATASKATGPAPGSEGQMPGRELRPRNSAGGRNGAGV